MHLGVGSGGVRSVGWGPQAVASGTLAPLTELRRVKDLRPLLPPPPVSSPRLFLSRNCNTPSATLPSLPPPLSSLLWFSLTSQDSGSGSGLWGGEVSGIRRRASPQPLPRGGPAPLSPRAPFLGPPGPAHPGLRRRRRCLSPDGGVRSRTGLTWASPPCLACCRHW